MKRIRSRFLKIQCNKCKSEQVVFGCAKTPVKCLNCGIPLLVPTGGKAELVKTRESKNSAWLCNGKIVDILDKNL